MDKEVSNSIVLFESGKENDDQGSSKLWVEEWLSAPRFKPYLDACNGDIGEALNLYQWNIRISQVLSADISHFEVALRNAYNRVLSMTWEGEAHWLIDDDSPVRRPIIRRSGSKRLLDVNVVNRKVILHAQKRAHDSCDSNQIIANLTFGFWTHLTDRSRERDLWIPYLHKAWPNGTDRAKLHRSISAINTVRNRVAHNERLFNPACEACLPTAVDAAIVNLLSDLCPVAAKWLYGGTNETPVEALIKEYPAPVGVIV